LQSKIQQLSSSDLEQIDQTQEQIATQHGANAVDCLVNLIQDESKDQQHRINAIWALNAVGADAKAAVPGLVSVVKDGNETLSLQAMRVLGNLSINGVELQEEDPSILNVLVSKFRSNHPLELRIAALDTLAIMDTQSANVVSELVALLADTEQAVQISAINALRQIGPEAKEAVLPLIEVLQRSNNSELQKRAIEALGAIGIAAKPAISELKNFLTVSDEQVQLAAAKSLNQIANDLANNANDFEQLPTSELRVTIRHLEDVLQVLKANASQFDPEDIASTQRAIDELQRERSKRELALLKHPMAIVLEVYIALFAISLLLLWLLPTALLKLNYLLRPFTLTIPTPLGGTLSLSAQQLVLVRLFNSHPRVLDAWVEARIDKAKDRFAHKSTVRERQIYVPLPVVLNDRTPADLEPTDLKATFAQKRWRLLIWGEGGIGKTTLACQIAQWAMASAPTDRPCSHRMLPILLEEGLDSLVLRHSLILG
jgi:HEAT repeat protein